MLFNAFSSVTSPSEDWQSILSAVAPESVFHIDPDKWPENCSLLTITFNVPEFCKQLRKISPENNSNWEKCEFYGFTVASTMFVIFLPFVTIWCVRKKLLVHGGSSMHLVGFHWHGTHFRKTCAFHSWWQRQELIYHGNKKSCTVLLWLGQWPTLFYKCWADKIDLLVPVRTGGGFAEVKYTHIHYEQIIQDYIPKF